MIYFAMALFLFDEKREGWQELKREAERASLRQLKAEGYKRVSVCSESCCDACNALNGSVYAIDEAIEEGLLPVASQREDWCNSSWSPA